MNEQQTSILNQALQSTNVTAMVNIAHIFEAMGETAAANDVMNRVHSLSYGFGVDYAAVQTKLNALGVAQPPLTVDGQWGAKSKAALVTYQKSKGLTADGIPGPITLGSLGISNAGNVSSSTMGSVTPASASADAQAYAIAQKGGKEMGLTDREIQYVVAVARGEGHYGSGWKNPSAATIAKSKAFGLTGYEGADSNNWGATQGTGNAGSFPHVDSGWMVPDANGKPTSKHWTGSGPKVWGDYVANYKKYATPEDGFKDMAKIILGGGLRKAAGAAEIKTAIAAGNLTQAVNAQHANGYFELDPSKYLQAVLSNYNSIMNGIGWPKILSENGITPVKAGIGAAGVILGLSAMALYLFRKELGLVA